METKKGIILNLRIRPNSKEFAVKKFDEWDNSLHLNVKSKALKGNANREIIKEVEKLFGARIEILAGKTSRKKKIFVPIEKQRFQKLLNNWQPSALIL